MSTDVIISHVTFPSKELALRLEQQWRFVSIDQGKALIHGEPVALFDKRGPTVRLSPIGPRPVVRWLAWAIQEICPEAEAADGEEPIAKEPMTDEEAQQAVQELIASRKAAIAREADPSGGAHEATALVTYLVDHGLLELSGSAVAVVRAIVPLLREVDEDIGTKLEDVLLELDEVDELFADADQLSKIIAKNAHVLEGPPP